MVVKHKSRNVRKYKRKTHKRQGKFRGGEIQSLNRENARSIPLKETAQPKLGDAMLSSPRVRSTPRVQSNIPYEPVKQQNYTSTSENKDDDKKTTVEHLTGAAKGVLSTLTSFMTNNKESALNNNVTTGGRRNIRKSRFRKQMKTSKGTKSKGTKSKKKTKTHKYRRSK